MLLPEILGVPVNAGPARGASKASVDASEVPSRVIAGVDSVPVKLGEVTFAFCPSAVVRVGML